MVGTSDILFLYYLCIPMLASSVFHGSRVAVLGEPHPPISNKTRRPCTVFNISLRQTMLRGVGSSFSFLQSRNLLVPRLLTSHLHSTARTHLSTEPGSAATPSEELVPERLYTKVNIKVKGADYAVLDSYCRYVITAGKALGINIGGRVALPTRIQKFTVLKSPHIYKKHRVQYEIRTHSRLMQVKHITGTTADIFLEYIQRNLPEGIDMSVYQEELDSLPALLTGPPEGEEVTDEPTTRKKKRQT